jgi:serine/threonine protein kinase
MQSPRTAESEPIPGYRLLSPLGKGGFGEVWKCQAPGGLHKAIKFVRGGDGQNQTGGAELECRALEHIKSIRHPFLLSMDRIEVVGGDLVIVMELADRSLHDLLQEHRQTGRPGIPRGELLGYLREAAEVLDLMNQEHGLQHLDIKPRNLFLVGKHIKVGDFGLVNRLTEGQGEVPDLLGGLTPLYASPETFESRPSLFSDQYSLAVTFCELLTGELPLQGKNTRQVILSASMGQHDLSRLQAGDRAVVSRALNRDPGERFPSCQAFIDALLEVAATDDGLRRRPQTTSFDVSLDEMSSTAVVAPQGSGFLRRRSRVTPAVRASGSAGSEEVLAGFRLLECLSRGPLGELWRATGPRGEQRLVRFLAVGEKAPSRVAFDHLLSVRHQALAALELVEAGPGRLALLSEAGESSLAGRLRECQSDGLPGIPRNELLDYLARTAEALDQIYHVHQLQHLALSPRHLALGRGDLIILEFGLAELVWVPLGQHPATLNPRYAAVELFDGLISDACDQFSLALMYQELLVGFHPYRNLNARQLASPKLRGQPDLALLPATDRSIIRQALSVEPEKRFRSCREFVQALEAVTRLSEAGQAVPSAGTVPTRVVAALAGTNAPGASSLTPPWQQAIDELVGVAARGHEIHCVGQVNYRLTPGHEVVQHAWARLPPGMARLKLAGFREQWQADVLKQTEKRWLLDVRTPRSLWQICLGRMPGLLVDLVLGHESESAGPVVPVRIRLQPIDCGRGKAVQVLSDLGPALLSSLHTYLNTQSTRAEQERYPLAQTAHVQSRPAGLSVSVQLRDVGRGGLSLLSPCPLPLGPVTLTLNRWASSATVQVPGCVRDCLPVGDKAHEVEVRLGG